MTYTGLELFMENLGQLSYSNNYPHINNHPAILSERPQIQLLYKELTFMIQIMFAENQNDIHGTEQVRNLKKRFKDVALEAQNIVGLFVYSISYRNTTYPSIYESIKYFLNWKNVKRSINYKRSLNLENVMRDINSIKEEFIMILDNLKMDSSSSIKPLKAQTSAETSHTRNSLGSKKVLEEIVVGFDHDVELIRDKLVEDQKQLDVVSIVGMGGVGKTTLATKVFNDRFVVYHFTVRAWATVSQTYEKQDLLVQLLRSIGIEVDTVRDSYFRLREILHKSLMDKRYLIVVDDIWSTDAWNDLRLFLPNGNTGSRILLTSRLTEVALHAKAHGFVHHLEYLTNQESWELLHKKVFHGNDCPKWLIEPGMEIAKNCHGLPLAVVVIAGILAKEKDRKDSWERIAQCVSSYIVSDRKGFMDILALSYDHLPAHLKDCFLYLGAFPEDHKFSLRRLIWLWMAEGFVQGDGERSLEKIGEDYLMELVDRNLVVVVDRKVNGAIKACSVHDLLRELCLERATKENFCMNINTAMSSFGSMRRCKTRRIFTNRDFLINNVFDQVSPWVQSLFLFHNDMSITNGYFRSYPLLMVLDLQKCRLENFPPAIGLLVHLRYIAFWYTKGFPSSICNLHNLQTIIARSSVRMYIPTNISNLVNLRHLWSDGYMYFPPIEKPINLQTISNVALRDVAESWLKSFPCIRKLTCTTLRPKNQDFMSLNYLETLMWINVSCRAQLVERVLTTDAKFRKIHVTFPASLKKLSLSGCYLPWSDMSIVQSLPNLAVLNILEHAFMGPKWETGEVQFRQLKSLKLQGLDIFQWVASSINFPCLKHLVLDTCRHLEEIPLEIGDISTLELIDVDESSSSVIESLDKIREEQEDFGNYDLKINVRKVLSNLSVSRKLRGLAWIVDW